MGGGLPVGSAPARAYRTEKTCRGKADRKVQRTCVVVTAMDRVYYVNLFSAYPNNITKIVDFGTHFKSILGPWADLGPTWDLKG